MDVKIKIRIKTKKNAADKIAFKAIRPRSGQADSVGVHCFEIIRVILITCIVFLNGGETVLENWYHPLDPYHITIIIPIWVTVLWYFMFGRKMVKLQNLDVSKWRVNVHSVAERIHNFADRLVQKHSPKSHGFKPPRKII